MSCSNEKPNAQVLQREGDARKQNAVPQKEKPLREPRRKRQRHVQKRQALKSERSVLRVLRRLFALLNQTLLLWRKR